MSWWRRWTFHVRRGSTLCSPTKSSASRCGGRDARTTLDCLSFVAQRKPYLRVPSTWRWSTRSSRELPINVEGNEFCMLIHFALWTISFEFQIYDTISVPEEVFLRIRLYFTVLVGVNCCLLVTWSLVGFLSMTIKLSVWMLFEMNFVDETWNFKLFFEVLDFWCQEFSKIFFSTHANAKDFSQKDFI